MNFQLSISEKNELNVIWKNVNTTRRNGYSELARTVEVNYLIRYLPTSYLICYFGYDF